MKFSFWERLFGTSLKTRMRRTTYLLIMLPLTVLSILMYIVNLNLYQKTSNDLFSSALSQSKNSFNVIINRAVYDANFALVSTPVQAALSRPVDKYDLGMQLDDMRTLISFFQSTEFTFAGNSIRLGVRDGLIYSNARDYFLNLNTVEPLVESLHALGGEVWFTGSRLFDNTGVEYRVLTYAKLIRSIDNYEKILGVILVDVPFTQIEECMALVLNGNAAGAALVDPYGGFCAQTGQKNVKYDVTLPLAGGWALMASALDEAIIDWGHRTALLVLMVYFALIVLTVLTGNALNRSILKRFSLIISSMEQVREGVFDKELQVWAKDDIGKVENSFNHMLSDMRTLLVQTEELSKRNHSLELLTVQAQINPHLLYNMLNSIAWLAHEHGDTDVFLMVKKLSQFYRASLHTIEGEHLLSEEIAHMRLYVDIQNIRYGNCVTCQITVEQACEACVVPVLLLQPLVENSIVHGIMPFAQKKGVICVTALKADNHLVMTVADNGVSIPQETIDDLNADGGHQRQSYGIYTIRERLKLKYGKEASLLFASGEEGGVTVTIHLPYIVEMDTDS